MNGFGFIIDGKPNHRLNKYIVLKRAQILIYALFLFLNINIMANKLKKLAKKRYLK